MEVLQNAVTSSAARKMLHKVYDISKVQQKANI